MFASNHAHRVFPCFDQPDMKAKFMTRIEGPENWFFLSNMNPCKISKFKDGKGES